MRKLLTTVAGVALVAGLAAPAGAETTAKPADRPITAERHHRDDRPRSRPSGPYAGTRSEDPESGPRSPDGDPPGEGRSHYDREQHDDPVLF
jgi:hypothetical protein